MAANFPVPPPDATPAVQRSIEEIVRTEVGQQVTIDAKRADRPLLLVVKCQQPMTMEALLRVRQVVLKAIQGTPLEGVATLVTHGTIDIELIEDPRVPSPSNDAELVDNRPTSAPGKVVTP